MGYQKNKENHEAGEENKPLLFNLLGQKQKSETQKVTDEDSEMGRWYSVRDKGQTIQEMS